MIWIVILTYLLCMYLVVYLKLTELRMGKFRAVIRTLIFPIKITQLHLKLFIEQKDKGLANRLKIIIYPFIYPSSVVTSYGIMYIKADVFMKTFPIVLSELNEEEQKSLIDNLIQEGVIKRVKPSPIKRLIFKILFYILDNFSTDITVKTKTKTLTEVNGLRYNDQDNMCLPI